MIDSSEKAQLMVFVGLVLLELLGDSTLAQIPIVGDMGNTGLDVVLNIAELYLGVNLAKD